ncbi:MAG: hypothetical protein ACE366_16030 [Bradymonadia bacterium]
MPSAHLLDDLNDINWPSLQHAYGDASDTPTHLRRYWSSKHRRRDAMIALRHSIYHQSGGFSASAAAMPFLLRMLADPQAPLATDLLRLVVLLGAHGNVYTLATHGYASREIGQWLSRWYGPDLQHFHSCRALYVEASDLFIELLDRPGPRFRAWVAYALGHLPEHHTAITPALQRRYDRETHPITRVSILIALGVLSRAAAPADHAQLARWLAPRRRRARHPSLQIAHTVATLYLSPSAPSAKQKADLIELLAAPAAASVYPMPWLDGALDALCGELLLALTPTGWPASEILLEGYRRWAQLNPTTRDVDHGPGRRLLRQVLQAGDPSVHTAVLTEIALRPGLIARYVGELQRALDAAQLPRGLKGITAHLGWQPPPPVRRTPTLAAQLPEASWASHVPAVLRQCSLELPVMLLRFYPFAGPVLDIIAPLLPQSSGGDRAPWRLLSANPHLHVDDACLEAHRGQWSMWHLLQNPAITLRASWVERWRDRMHWGALSRRVDFPWSTAFLDRYAEVLDWDALSSNTGLPWSEDLVVRYADQWSWSRLSQNPALPWSLGLVMRRFRRWFSHLSSNDGLPWSDAFLHTLWDRWDPEQLCAVNTLPWSEGLLERHADVLTSWQRLSANTGLPWSVEFIERHIDHWHWDQLSSNPALPWSTALILEHADRWQWGRLMQNPAVTWSDPLVSALAERAHTVSTSSFRSLSPHLPWSVEWLRDPRLHRVLCEGDAQLHQRLLAPLLNDERVLEIFRSFEDRRHAHARSRWAHLQRARPEMTLNDPLPEALGLTEALSGQRPHSPKGA